MSRIGLRTRVINILLDGKEVCGTLIAQELGCAPESVNFILRELSKYLAKRPAPHEPGKNRVYFRAADRDGLIEERDKNRRMPKQIGKNRLSFDALLQTWHISKPAGCPLPSLVHRMETEEDELFEEAA